jgi:putative hydrolases of HD superfamily
VLRDRKTEKGFIMNKKKATQQTANALADLFFEAGMLKRSPRSGWFVAGVPQPESVADHSFRCALIAYVIATLEGVDPEKVMAMALFHDLHEARITDLHKMAKKYLDSYASEGKIFEQQTAGLPTSVKNRLRALRNEDRAQRSLASKIVRDADILECFIQAKEYYENGIASVKPFFKNGGKQLTTKSAKALWRASLKRSSRDWWAAISSS